MTPSYWNDATREPSGRDPVLRVLIRNLEGSYLQSRSDAFTTLARSIVGQQISVSAAESVWQKLLESVERARDRKSTRLNSSHANISYAVFCLKKKKKHGIPNGLSHRRHVRHQAR